MTPKSYRHLRHLHLLRPALRRRAESGQPQRGQRTPEGQRSRIRACSAADSLTAPRAPSRLIGAYSINYDHTGLNLRSARGSCIELDGGALWVPKTLSGLVRRHVCIR